MANGNRVLLSGIILLSGCGLTLKPKPPEAIDETQSGWEYDKHHEEGRWEAKEVKGAKFSWEVKPEK